MRVVVAGCGDVGLRLLARYQGRANFIALARSPDQCAAIRELGARALMVDLDQPDPRKNTLVCANRLIYLAPPDSARSGDPRLADSLRALLKPARFTRRNNWRAATVRHVAYTSTTGVFGDAGGRRLTETDVPKPQSARAKRRVAAEQLIRQYTRKHHFNTQVIGSIFRAPGIYAQNRLPVRRLEQKLPCLVSDEDGVSNRIHALDLARIMWFGLFKGRGCRTYIATDGQTIKSGDAFDQIADALGMDRPQRLPAKQVKAQVSEMTWSFMRESRALSNDRLLREFRIKLEYPTLSDTLRAVKQTHITQPSE
jgi:nucleoside-diphosphate-sugar epimerase